MLQHFRSEEILNAREHYRGALSPKKSWLDLNGESGVNFFYAE